MCHPHDIVQHTTLIFALISPTLLTLVHYPRYPRQQNNHVTHSGTPPASPTLARYPRKHAPTLALHPRQHATHANMPVTPPTLACHPLKHTTHATHTSTPPTPPTPTTLARIVRHFSNSFFNKALSFCYFRSRETTLRKRLLLFTA